MIPTLAEILRMLKADECTVEQAEQWLGAHVDNVVQREVLRDTFASMAAIGRDADGNLVTSSVIAVMGAVAPPPIPSHDSDPAATAAERFKWWCTAEARIRYAKAEAMLEARLC